MKASEIKFKATNLLTNKVYHFTLNDLGIDGDIVDGAYTVIQTKEGVNIPWFNLEDEYDIELEK